MVEKRFEKLGMPDIERFENYLPTAFNSELTLLQKVNKIIFDLIETNKLTNEMVDYLNEFIETFDEKLYKTIEDVLNVWLEDGRLADIVRVAISEEVVNARTDYLDHTYLNLKERLDLERKEVILARGGAETLGERFDNQIGLSNEFRGFEADESFMKRVYNEQSERGVNVKWFGAIGDGVTDDTVAIQSAIDFVRRNLLASAKASNKVIFPSGKYLHSDTLESPPYLKLKGVGNVELLYVGVDVTKPAIHVKWHGVDPERFYLSTSNATFSWQREPLLDNIVVMPTNSGTGLTGIEFSARDNNDRYSGWKNIARTSIKEVTIKGFEVGVQINPLDFYLFDFNKCHIENNKINIQIGGANFKGQPMNCGENINFKDCILSSSDIMMNQIYGGFDCTFNNCGIDFNQLVLKTAEYANNSILFLGGNLEGNNHIVDATKSYTIAWRPTITLSKNHLLLHKNGTQSPVFYGYMNLVVDDVYQIALPNGAKNPENGQLLNYLCDDKVRISFKSPYYLGRPYNFLGFLWQERLNRFASGKNLASATGVSFWRNVFSLKTGLDVDADMRQIGLLSSFKFIATDVAKYDSVNFGTKINTNGSLNLRLYTIVKMQSASIRTIKAEVNSYDVNDVKIETIQSSFSVSSSLPHALMTAKSNTFLPVTTEYVKINIIADSFLTGESIEIGYVYADFS